MSPTLSTMTERFVSEAMQPVTATADTARMAAGEPGLPRQFVWRGRQIEVRALVRSWRETGPCHHGSDEQYARRHWYEVLTTDGLRMKLYFDRQPRAGGRARSRWWVFSVAERSPDTP